MSQTDENNLCGFDGDQDEPATKHELNRWVRTALVFHIRPWTQKMSRQTEATERIEQALTDHTHREELRLAEISGGLKIWRWMIGAVLVLSGTIIAGVLWYVNKYLIP